MRVLYFHQHFSTPNGSAGIRSYQMATRLVDKGHSVTIVCGSYGGGSTGLEMPFLRGRRRGNVDGIDIIEFNLAYSNSDGFIKRASTFLKFAFRSIGLVFTEKYDVVFATTTPLTAGVPGVVARWILRKPFVFEVRDLWPELPKAMGVIRNPIVLTLMSILEWTSYRSAHRCIGLSPGIVQGIEKKGVSIDKIEMIPNGCDLDIFGGETTHWRPQGINNDDLLAVFAGTHGVANGLISVLEGAIELKKRGQNGIKILLIGQGKLKSQLIDYAKQHQLDNVIFHDPVSKSQLASLFASADVGLQILANVPAFYYGTSPNKFFDYLSAGLPVLNNYPGWLSELIQKNGCGYVVPPEDPQAFADALEHAVTNRTELKDMGVAAQTLAVDQFNRRDLADRWVRWVEGAVK